MSRECYSRRNQQYRNRSWNRPNMYKNDSYRPRVGQYPGIQNNNYNRYGRNDNYAENVDNRRQYGNPQVHPVNTTPTPTRQKFKGLNDAEEYRKQRWS